MSRDGSGGEIGCEGRDNGGLCGVRRAERVQRDGKAAASRSVWLSHSPHPTAGG